jgi:hypothetical protein
VDGGAVLLAGVDRGLGLTARLAASLHDGCQPGKVVHGLVDLVRQRVFGMACGYADCNDATTLRDDPIHKLLLERDPLDGAGLADQSTLSRFENAAGPRDLYRMASELMDVVIEENRKRLPARRIKRITIDLDPTEDPTHGHQQLALFNGHYDAWCYLPLLAFVTFDKEPEHQLYRDRGDSENRVKELKNDLELDRTSCMRFWANQLRVLLTAAAFVLFQQMRLRLSRRTNEERPTAGTMRLRLLKIAVWRDPRVAWCCTSPRRTYGLPSGRAWHAVAAQSCSKIRPQLTTPNHSGISQQPRPRCGPNHRAETIANRRAELRHHDRAPFSPASRPATGWNALGHHPNPLHA